MKVRTSLNDFLEKTIPSMHNKRRQALVSCTQSTAHGAALTVTAIGRNLESSAYQKHSIKRADRLCSNGHLFRESTLIYQAICRYWIPQHSRPIILVDWSDLDDCKHAFLISATLAYEGRSLTLYNEVHGLQSKEKPATHQAFLNNLKHILPSNCRPIIVADAGFKVPWHKMVVALGWDYVGRVRQPNLFCITSKVWRPISSLFKQATKCPKKLAANITKSNDFATTLVLYRKAAKGRHNLNASGVPRQSKHSKQHAKGEKEPWVLATSLTVTNKLAVQVVKIYQKRMQIEEGFRDIKSRLHGLGFNQSKSWKLNRIVVLMLIAALACMVLIIIGTAVEIAGLHRRYQANTIKHRRVLSYHYLGRLAVVDKNIRLSLRQYLDAIESIERSIVENGNHFS